MPKIDGYEVCRRLKKEPLTFDILWSVTIITAAGIKDFEKQCLPVAQTALSESPLIQRNYYPR